jgi:RNA polymerase sigma-32 factor
MKNNIAAASQDNLARYLREISQFALLDAETELALARRYRDHGDTEAARRLANAYLRLVVKIAKGFRGYNVPLGDLVSEGNVGLMKAIERFDPERGFRLSTYASWWIRAEIQEAVLRAASMVRIGTTAAQKKLFFNLRRLKNARDVVDDGELAPETVAAIAHALDVDETEVVEMNHRLASATFSLNAATHTGGEGDSEFLDLLVDETADQETSYAEAEELARRRRVMVAAMGALNEREREILTERRLTEDPPTLEVLSEKFAISRERVRQIEVRAFEKLQKAMRGAVCANDNAAALAG